jgi:hypothetical protein
MSAQKIKVSLEPGQSYVVADTVIWEDLSYTIRQIADQWENGSEEKSLWLEYLNYFESQYKANLLSERFEEEDGWK